MPPVPGVVDAGGKLPSISMIPAANLPPVSRAPVSGGKLLAVSTTPAAYLSPVSMTPVANIGNNVTLLTH